MIYEALRGHGVYCVVVVLLTVHGTLPKFCVCPNLSFFKFARMDQLTAEQQEALRKNATE